jgi:hypothetical protein
MSLFYRRLLFGFFVLLFCILVPVVLIYATGNTINWRRLSLEKTSNILISSEPTGATIFLNNKLVSDSLLGFLPRKVNLTTQAKIQNLLPGEYIIRLVKDGYWPWEQRFTLTPEEAKNLGTIKLFKKTEPKLILTTGGQADLASDGQKFAIFKNNNLIIFNTTDETSQTIPLNSNQKITATKIAWSNNDSKISLANLIIDLANKKVINLAADLKKDVSLIRWGNNSDIAYFLSKQKIWRYTISSKTLMEVNLDEQINNQKIIDYIIRNDELYIIIENLAGQDTLLSGSLEGQLKAIQLPSGDYQFILDQLNKPALINNHELYIIDEPIPLFSEPRLIKVTDNFRLGRAKGSSLIYTTTLELRRWDNETNDYLLTRFGSVINSLWPLSKTDSVIVATPDDIRVFVNEQQPFTITLANIKNAGALMATSDEKTLYVFGTYNNQTGIFSLGL